MKKTVILVRLFMLIIGLCAPLVMFAQVGFDSTDVTDAPIDGGVSLLIIAGVGYGAKKLAQKRKERDTVSDK